jgi:hypothetical protein
MLPDNGFVQYIRGAELQAEPAAARSAVLSIASVVRVMRGLRAVERTTSNIAQRSIMALRFAVLSPSLKKEKLRTF